MSGKIYRSQDNLVIQLSYQTSPGVIASGKIRYRRPDGVMGSWPAVVDLQQKTFTVSFARGESLGMAGLWTFWAVATLSDGRVHPGTAVEQQIWQEGY